MKITIVNVGYGDSLLFETTEGKRLLMDGGSNLASEFENDPYRIRCADYLKEKKIDHLDVLIMSHIHEDHICGLEPLLERITVGEIYTPYAMDTFTEAKEVALAGEEVPRSAVLYTKALNAFGRMMNHAKAKGIQVKQLKAGDEIHLFGTMKIRVLGPAGRTLASYQEMIRMVYSSSTEKGERSRLLTSLDALSNHTSLLLYMEMEDIVMLAAADNVPDQWSDVSLSLLQNVNVLKLPHHGQRDSIDPEIMGQMQLQYVITTASSDRRYNSANPEVYRTLCQLFEKRQVPEFLFSDEREYEPYFQQEGFNAIILFVDSGTITTEFSKV